MTHCLHHTAIGIYVEKSKLLPSYFNEMHFQSKTSKIVNLSYTNRAAFLGICMKLIRKLIVTICTLNNGHQVLLLLLLLLLA